MRSPQFRQTRSGRQLARSIARALTRIATPQARPRRCGRPRLI